ncbi:MAG: ThiF family adenylyltransferase [Corynebacterium sp.]|nr:ThiF family adenylyltransferase [Corynebacterium sp.]
MTNRYLRQLQLPGFGPPQQQQLSDAHVCCVGAGGLGSPALLYLAAAGVGTITIIDDDQVELTNLHRQIIHTTTGIGRPKVESARDTIAALNPDILVITHHKRLTWEESETIFANVDMVLDGTDNIDTRYVISARCARLGIPHIWASILGFSAQLSVFHAGHGPIYEDLFPIPPLPGDVPSCAQAGVLGPIVGVVGSAMAMEALKLITTIGKPLIGTIAYYDGLTSRWEYIPLVADPDVEKQVANNPPRRTLAIPTCDSPTGVLIDVREPAEYNRGTLPGAVNIPLSAIEAGRTDVPDGALLFCQAGVRSQRAGIILTAAGVTGLRSLAGGYERHHV